MNSSYCFSNRRYRKHLFRRPKNCLLLGQLPVKLFIILPHTIKYGHRRNSLPRISLLKGVAEASKTADLSVPAQITPSRRGIIFINTRPNSCNFIVLLDYEPLPIQQLRQSYSKINNGSLCGLVLILITLVYKLLIRDKNCQLTNLYLP